MRKRVVGVGFTARRAPTEVAPAAFATSASSSKVDCSGVSESARVEEEAYRRLAQHVRDRLAAHSGPLFTTDVDPEALWAAYLGGLPDERRQHYTCTECRRFVKRFGGLVTVEDTNWKDVRSLLWSYEPTLPPFFARGVERMRRIVSESKITGVFYVSSSACGTRQTFDLKTGATWSHLSGDLSAACSSLSVSRLKTCEQASAEKLEEFGMLKRSLADYSNGEADEAVRVLSAGVLDRSEKALAIAGWFAGQFGKSESALWLATAKAPVGFAHVRASVLGTLLDDIKAKLPFADIKRKWDAKLDPLAYMRPQAAPAAGAVKRAEDLVARMCIERSLQRRFATLDDVQSFVWRPSYRPYLKREGVFAGVPIKNDTRHVTLPPQTLTMAKFLRDVLPSARSLEVGAPRVGNYYGMLAAADPSAPPILQWDEAADRNTCSCYVYSSGSYRENWNLAEAGYGDVFVPCHAASRLPHQWREGNKFAHHTDGIMFALEGCRDTKRDTAGLGLFPEILKNDLREVRSVIESFSRTNRISGLGGGDANGLLYAKGSTTRLKFRVDGDRVYTVDRWD